MSVGNIQDRTLDLTEEDIEALKEGRLQRGFILDILRRESPGIHSAPDLVSQSEVITPGPTKLAIAGTDLLSTVQENPIVDETRGRVFFIYDRSTGPHLLAAIPGTSYSTDPNGFVYPTITIGAETRKPTAWAFNSELNMMAVAMGQLSDGTGEDAKIYFYRMKFDDDEQPICLAEGCNQEGNTCDRTLPNFGENLGFVALDAEGYTGGASTGEVDHLWWYKRGLDWDLGFVCQYRNDSPSQTFVAWQKLIVNIENPDQSELYHVMSWGETVMQRFNTDVDSYVNDGKMRIVSSTEADAFAVIKGDALGAGEQPFGYGSPTLIKKVGKYLVSVHGDVSGTAAENYEYGWQPNVVVLDLDNYERWQINTSVTRDPTLGTIFIQDTLAAQGERLTGDLTIAGIDDAIGPMRMLSISHDEITVGAADIRVETDLGSWDIDFQNRTALVVVYARSFVKIHVTRTDAAGGSQAIELTAAIYNYPPGALTGYFDLNSAPAFPTQVANAFVPASTPVNDAFGNPDNTPISVNARATTLNTTAVMTANTTTNYTSSVPDWVSYPDPLIYKDAVLVDRDEYTVNYDDGEIDFLEAVAEAVDVTATFYNHDAGTCIPLIVNAIDGGMRDTTDSLSRVTVITGSVTHKPLNIESLLNLGSVTKELISTDLYDIRFEDIVFFEESNSGQARVGVTDKTWQGTPGFTNGKNSYVRFMDTSTGEKLPGEFHLTGWTSPVSQWMLGMAQLKTRGEVWIIQGVYDSGTKGIRIWRFWQGIDPKERKPENPWTRPYADAVLDGTYEVDAQRGMGDRLIDYSLSQSREQASMKLSLTFHGASYAQGVKSRFNELRDGSGDYAGLFDPMNRIRAYSALKLPGRKTKLFEEFNGYILDSNASSAKGLADISITCGGVIAGLVTRRKFEGYFSPTVNHYVDVTLTAQAGSGDTVYTYVPSGSDILNWASNPAPIIKIDDVISEAAQIDIDLGTVTFGAAKTANTIKATFDAYEAGTNEVEDIIRCILLFPNQSLGCGLSEDYFTRYIAGEAMTDSGDGLTFSAQWNNWRIDKTPSIYVGTVLTGSGFTVDRKNGEITFDASKSGQDITIDYDYLTLQKTGITISPIEFTFSDQKTAWDCIQEVLEHVAPNYIVNEGPDGIIQGGYRTQKAVGSEDFDIEVGDRVTFTENKAPMLDSISTAVLSFGSESLQHLPNSALGVLADSTKPPNAEFPSWSPENVDGVIANITDGDPNVGWGEGWGSNGSGHSICENAGSEGVPLFELNLGEATRIQTIIFSRSDGHSPPLTLQVMSLWSSPDGIAWTKIVSEFGIGPSSSLTFEAGREFPKFIKPQYIQGRMHSMGRYHWKRGNVNYEWHIGNIYIFSETSIKGEARLQNEDISAPYFDVKNLLIPYGLRTYTARSGKSDPFLTTLGTANSDAGEILSALIERQERSTIKARFLPNLQVYNTIKAVNGPLQSTSRFLIEGITRTKNGDSYRGITVP